MTPQQASPPVTVRGAETGEAEAVGRLVAEAFQDDEPSTTWIFPDPRPRARRLPRLFTALARHRYLPRGRVDVAVVDGVVVGTAMWAPPQLRGDSLAQTLRMLPDVVGAMGGRLLHGMYQEHLAVRSRGDAPHWYLADLAVSDPHRGLGFGGALLRRVLDDAGSPALLECKDDNVPYYQRFGFEVVDRFTLPRIGRTPAQTMNTLRRNPFAA